MNAAVFLRPNPVPGRDGYRHEFKYVIDPLQKAGLRHRLPAVLQRDAHAGKDGVYTIHDDEEDMAVGFHIEAEHEDTDSIDIMFEGTDEVIPMSFYEPKSVIEEVLYILDTTNVVPLKDVSAA